MKPWVLITAGLIFSSSAHAFSPTVEGDEVGSSVQFGSSFLLQTVSMNKHFVIRNERPNSFFLRKEQSELGPEEKPSGNEFNHSRDLLNLSWMLGYAYYRTSGPDPVTGNQIYDEAHAIKGGLAWEIAKVFDLVGSVTYQVMPAESYSQGIYDMFFSYTLPLRKEAGLENNGNSNPNDLDAENYYQRRAAEADIQHTPAKERFPNLTLGGHACFLREIKSKTTSGRTAGSTLASDLQLNGTELGPEFDFNVSRRLSLKMEVLFYSYDTDVGIFLSNTTLGGTRRKADLAVADLEGTTALLLTFPKKTVTGSFDYRIGTATDLKVAVSYSTYFQTGTTGAGLLNSTISTGGILDFAFSERWKVGGVVDVTSGTGYSAAVGGLRLGYAL